MPDIAVDTAQVTVGPRDALLVDRLRVRDVQLSRALPEATLAQVRAHGTPVAAVLANDEIVFASPQARVAPGQVVAFYDGDVCCGGAIVAE